MSTEASFEDLTEGAVQRLGEMHSKIAFDELLDYATEVCIKQHIDYTPEKQPELDTEKDVVMWLGLRGVRAAIELSEEYTRMSHYEEEDEPESGERLQNTNLIRVDLDTPFKNPLDWSTPLDHEVLLKTERFGKALTDEAYMTLGTDVFEKIHALQDAKSSDEQLKVIRWLDRRIKKMRDKLDTRSDDESRHFYHPARLSPKLIGVYPNHELAPTCLSISVIAASFFEKAGLATLHAGVNESGSEKNVTAGISLIHDLLEVHQSAFNVQLSEASINAIHSVLNKLKEASTREDAQHAAVYTQLLDGKWVQFDPNYQATFRIETTDTNEQLSKAYTNLKEMNSVAPGLEISAILPDLAPSAELFQSAFEEQESVATQLMHAAAKYILTSQPHESVQQLIYNTCFEPFFNTSADKNTYLQLVHNAIAAHETLLGHTDIPEPTLLNAFYKTFERYVLWGDSLETFIDRIQTDEQYRNNRIDDIVALPFMAAVSIAKTEAEQGSPWFAHLKLDLGLPSHRIGFSVLNDFAAYDNESEITDSFWMSHWSGNVSVIEHMDKESASTIERTRKFANAAYYDIHPFTSDKKYEIIKSFLDATEEEERNDGRR